MTRQPGSESSIQWLLERIDMLEARLDASDRGKKVLKITLAELRRDFVGFRDRANLALFALGVALIGVLIAIKMTGG